MRLLLFGTGEYYNRYKTCLEGEEIVALADNARQKQGTYMDGALVIPPEDIERYEYDALVIMSFYVREIKAQLIRLGIDPQKIYHFFDLHDLVDRPSMRKKVRFYGLEEGKEEKGRRRILLLGQDLTLGGPALALYHAAKALRKAGCEVWYVSMIDGPLREILLQEGIPVVVDENLLVGTMEETEWIQKIKKYIYLIIYNTINYHVVLSERDLSIPAVWWLHDALFFYDGVNSRAMERISSENLKVWAVGPVARKAIQTYRPDLPVENLLYGVERTQSLEGGVRPDGIQTDKIVRFVTIGYIEPRKGQDILLNAIKGLDPAVRRRARFCFVGPDTTAMANEIRKEAENIPEMILTGPVGRETINGILSGSDVLVCPSREDPMPTVAAEAMMHGLPCLVSDAAGTAEYIRDGVDGILFPSGDAEQLKGRLEQCILGNFDLQSMGKKARRIFDGYFSMEAFERRLFQLIREADF